MKTVLNILIIIMVTIIIGILYFRIQYYDMTYVKSDIDGAYYLVRNVNDKQHASNMLSRIKQNIFCITKYVKDHRDEYPEMKQYIDQLDTRIKNAIIQENSKNSNYTSYSVNKGEQIVFCLRTTDDDGKLHDINLLMYVVIHEMAHVGCPEIGHTPLFVKIFKFLCYRSIDLKLYTKIEFDKNPAKYCGIDIVDSVV